jgi:hypothetical protein
MQIGSGLIDLPDSEFDLKCAPIAIVFRNDAVLQKETFSFYKKTSFHFTH